MNSIETARELDAEGECLLAAAAYEDALKSGGDDLSVYLDLAVLYFTLVDPGEVATHDFQPSFLDQAWNRANELLNEAERRFGSNSEIDFWKQYFQFVVLGAEPFVDECAKLADPSESLVPFFFLWLEAGDPQYRAHAEALFRQVARGRTARERYVRSMIERDFK